MKSTGQAQICCFKFVHKISWGNFSPTGFMSGQPLCGIMQVSPVTNAVIVGLANTAAQIKPDQTSTYQINSSTKS